MITVALYRNTSMHLGFQVFLGVALDKLGRHDAQIDCHTIDHLETLWSVRRHGNGIKNGHADEYERGCAGITPSTTPQIYDHCIAFASHLPFAGWYSSHAVKPISQSNLLLS